MKWYLALICKVVNTILQNFGLKWPDILNIHYGILLFLWVLEILTSNLIIFTKIIPSLGLQVINTNRVNGVYLLLYIYFFSETHNDFHKFILSPHMNYYGQWLIERQNCYICNLYSAADIYGILSTSHMILWDIITYQWHRYMPLSPYSPHMITKVRNILCHTRFIACLSY